jgi:hypothetical protein
MYVCMYVCMCICTHVKLYLRMKCETLRCTGNKECLGKLLIRHGKRHLQNCDVDTEIFYLKY